MKVLIINAGSSSIKFQLFEMDNESVIAKGNCEKIGLEGSFIGYKAKGGEEKEYVSMKNHTEALKVLLKKLSSGKLAVIKSFDEISAVGHRCVHGGWMYFDSEIITDELIANLEMMKDLSPLHATANIAGMVGCREVMPNTPQVVVFDTAFHSTMPPIAYMYGIKYEDYEKYHVRKYGFHGTSHRYIMQETAKVMGKKPEDLKIISCHIGNGSSITAIDHGKCVDTTMGFTPLEGVMMGTRTGDIDPTVLAFLGKRKGLNADQMVDYFNKECGVLGISGKSSDMRDINKLIEQGDKRAILARDILFYRISKYVGAMLNVLGGADAIVFTAGLGENQEDLREYVMDKLAYVGLKFDRKKNLTLPRGTIEELSTPDSIIKAYRIPTDEELLIARDTLKLSGLKK